jgi:hypothetical protein
MPAKLLDWRRWQKASLRGFAKVQFTSGLIFPEIGVYVAGARAWASPPSRVWVKDGAVVINEITGKPQYSPVVEFSTHGVRSSWSRQVLAAVREIHLRSLPED